MKIWAATAALCFSGMINKAEKNNKTCKIKLTFNQKKGEIYKVDHVETNRDFPLSFPELKISCQFVNSGI